MAYITDCNFSTATVRHSRTSLEFAHIHWSRSAIHCTKIATVAGAVIRHLYLTKIGSDLNQWFTRSSPFLHVWTIKRSH